MKNTITWIIVFGAVALAIVFLVIWQNKLPTVSVNAVSPQDNTLGNPQAAVVLYEYSDIQCPACRAYYPLLKNLMAEYGDRVLLVYRHFPLKQLHKNAEVAARATEAAAKQGKFWEMLDKLFENQANWANISNPKEAFIGYAKELQLDESRFSEDMDSSEIKQKVDNDYLSGKSIGINGTPTFFIDGEAIENPNSYNEFKSLIETALQ